MYDKITIAIADEHGLFRQGFGILLQSAGYQLFGEYKNVKDLIAAIGAGNFPDFVFMDIGKVQPGTSEAVTWLKENYPAVKVIVMSLNKNEAAVKEMISAGANGFVFKDIEPEEVKTAIKEVRKKGYYYSNNNWLSL